jgi:hypothetical protein
MTSLAEVVTLKQTQTVPWHEFEPLLARARQALGWTNAEITKAVGYDSSSQASAWQKQGKVATRAKYALLGLLAERDVKNERNVFTHAELSRLFAVLANIPVPEAERKALVAKIAKELAK